MKENVKKPVMQPVSDDVLDSVSGGLVFPEPVRCPYCKGWSDSGWTCTLCGANLKSKDQKKAR